MARFLGTLTSGFLKYFRNTRALGGNMDALENRKLTKFDGRINSGYDRYGFLLQVIRLRRTKT